MLKIENCKQNDCADLDYTCNNIFAKKKDKRVYSDDDKNEDEE